MPVSLEQWWSRRQRVTGRDVPYEIGRYRDEWAPFEKLVAQFRPDLNHGLQLSQIPPAAEVYLLWVCGIGHDFVATPAEQRARPHRPRSRRSWCPVCAEPPAVRPARRWPPAPVVNNSGLRASTSSDTAATPRTPRRTVDARPELLTPQAARRAALRGVRRAVDVRPGEAFVSAAASQATSAAQGELRRLLAERLDVDLTPNAVRVRTPFFGKLEVWPDIVLPEFGIAIEYDTNGRNADEHIGERERADRRKDRALHDVGWVVVRLRCRPLRPLGQWDVVVPGLSHSAVDTLVDRIAAVRGELFVAAYRRSR